MKIFCKDCRFYHHYTSQYSEYCQPIKTKETLQLDHISSQKEIYTAYHQDPSVLNKNNNCKFFEQSFLSKIRDLLYSFGIEIK